MLRSRAWGLGVEECGKADLVAQLLIMWKWYPDMVFAWLHWFGYTASRSKSHSIEGQGHMRLPSPCPRFPSFLVCCS